MKAGSSVITILRPGRENSFKLREKLRNVHSDSIPQYIVIDKIIAVNESISHADDLGQGIPSVPQMRSLLLKDSQKFKYSRTSPWTAPKALHLLQINLTGITNNLIEKRNL